jgi:hypothetical protein
MPAMQPSYVEVKGFPAYRVGSDGSIWVYRGDRQRIFRWKRLRCKRHNDKGKIYYRVALHNAGIKRLVFVHVLVLEAFVGPCPPTMQACHKDDNGENNLLSNLRWDTRQANILDAKRNNLLPIGEERAASKLTGKEVCLIRSLFEVGITRAWLARTFGVSWTSIKQILNRDYWRHI